MVEIAKIVVKWVLDNIFSPALNWFLNRDNWPWPALPAFLLLCMSAVTVVIVWRGQPSDCPLISEPRDFSSQQEFKDCDCCPTMVVLPNGTYVMGRHPEEPENKECGILNSEKVVIERPFAISKYEITIKNFRDFKAHQHSALDKALAVMLSSVNIDVNHKELGCHFFRLIGGGGEGEHSIGEQLSWQNPGFIQEDNHPVVCVDWNQAREYANWLSRKTKQEYKLPRAKEWEYAARGGTDEMQYWGKDTACRYANLHDEQSKLINKFYWEHAPCNDGYPEVVPSKGFMQTAPVGKFQSNKFNLHDMLGNVYEWVRDPASPAGHSMMRGGSWNAAPDRVRAIGCYNQSRTYRGVDVGFRVFREID